MDYFYLSSDCGNRMLCDFKPKELCEIAQFLKFTYPMEMCSENLRLKGVAEFWRLVKGIERSQPTGKRIRLIPRTYPRLISS